MKEIAIINGMEITDVKARTEIENLLEITYDATEIQKLLDKKQDNLVSGENIKTLNGQPVLGEGDIKVYAAYSSDTEPLDMNAQFWIDESEESGDFNELTFDDTPTLGSTNPVTSDGVKRALPTKTSELFNDSGYLTVHQDISGKEDISNKVTSISSTSTDTEYPSAKCIYDLIGDIETLLGGI